MKPPNLTPLQWWVLTMVNSVIVRQTGIMVQGGYYISHRTICGREVSSTINTLRKHALIRMDWKKGQKAYRFRRTQFGEKLLWDDLNSYL
jgi:hypothetical protein